MPAPVDPDIILKDYRFPLQLIRQTDYVERDEQGVTLYCSTIKIQRRHRDRYGTLLEIGIPTGVGQPAVVRIDVCRPDIIRLRMNPGDSVAVNNTPMVVEAFRSCKADFSLTEVDGFLLLCTGVLRVEVQKNPWKLCVRRDDGEVLFETLPADVFQHPPTGESRLDGNSITDAWPWFFRDLYPLGFVRAENGLTQTFLTAAIRFDEHFYGFGEKFSPIDKRTQAIIIWHENATGNTWPASYKNVPFFMSSKGYGLYINSAFPIKYHMGDLNHTRYSIHLQDEKFDSYFINGPSYKSILRRYTDITGKPALPPLWSFGLWMSRMSYRTQDEVEAVARELRVRDIPCDVIHIDTDWFERPWVNDFTFCKQRFPEPARMIQNLREQGFHLSLWQLPYISINSGLYVEGKERGYFAKRDDGEPYLIDGFFGPAAVIDYSNPEAVEWMQVKLRSLFEIGVSVIKADFGEGAPPDARYTAVPGLAMHNLYPLLYNQAIFEATVKEAGEGIIWGRSAYAGSQRFPVHWGGDPAALWDDLGNLWHGGLGLGLSGFPFWSVDIGGFAGTPTSELYTRWAQAGLFVSHPRAHGPIAREPWAFGENALQIFRKYAKLRYRLLPYIWTSAHHCVENSLPMMRPLLLDWQDDPTTAHIDDQYLFGEWIMIAPIIDDSNQRKVYFPKGRWFDYWTDEIIDGPTWRSINVPLEVLPIYIKGGAIIPMAPDLRYSNEKPWNPITLDCYPHGESIFELVSGERRVPLVCRQKNNRTIIQIGALDHDTLLQVHNVPRCTSVVLNGNKVFETEVEKMSLASWMRLDRYVLVKIPKIEGVKEVTLVH